MSRHHKQSYLYGMMILAVGTIAVKLIGALFKIPLTNILGGVGMSYFNVAYDLYYPLYALFISGVPVAVSKLVSESMARGLARDARRMLRLSATVFVGIGICGSVMMILGAQWFAKIVHNPDAKYAVMMLAPALFFGCITASFRGYFQGLQDMKPTAVSQIVEAAAKLVLGLSFALVIIHAGLHQYEQQGRVFGYACENLEEAKIKVLPYAAAGAILGVTISALCGAVYLYIHHKIGRGGIAPALWKSAPKAVSARILTKRLLAIALPVCFASVITNMTSFIDLVSVMNRLYSAIQHNAPLVLNMYRDAIPPGVELEQLASYLYGCYSGLAVPIFNLVPSMTAVVGVSLLPTVSAAWATNKHTVLEKNIESSLRVTAMIAMPAGIGITAMAEPIMRMLYFSKPMEVTAIAPALRLMGISSVFVAMTLPVNAILQAVGRAGLPVRLLLWGGLMKLALNYTLVAIPQLNIRAAPVGTLCCYAFVLAVSLSALIKTTDVHLSVLRVFGKPLFAAVCCGVCARMAYLMLSKIFLGTIATLASVLIGGIFYVFLLLITRTITKVDILMLPNAEKFINILEMHKLLG